MSYFRQSNREEESIKKFKLAETKSSCFCFVQTLIKLHT